ncbi:MAG: hypothetical protein FJX23_07875 [Alphaproteobacteria bacterium]|nr:hypothetical protein [Alphaproteobacteria bacterium]
MFGNRAAPAAPVTLPPVAEVEQVLAADPAPAFADVPQIQDGPSFTPPSISDAPSFAAPAEPQAFTPASFAPVAAAAAPVAEVPTFEPAPEVKQEATPAAVFNALPDEVKGHFGGTDYANLAPEKQAEFGEYLAASKEAATAAQAELAAHQQTLQTRADAIGNTLAALNELKGQDGVSGSDRVEAAALRVILEHSSAEHTEQNSALQVGGFDLLRKLADTLPDNDTKAKIVAGAEQLIESGLVNPLPTTAQNAIFGHAEAEASLRSAAAQETRAELKVAEAQQQQQQTQAHHARAEETRSWTADLDAKRAAGQPAVGQGQYL